MQEGHNLYVFFDNLGNKKCLVMIAQLRCLTMTVLNVRFGKIMT